MPLNDIFHFVQNTNNIASSGQPQASEFELIAQAKYKHVVNIAMHDSDEAIANEGQIVSSLGMDYYHLPVPFAAPTIEHLQHFIKLMRILQPDKIWVHCALNFRVSAFLYQYLKLDFDLSENQAKSEIFDFWRPDEKWQAIMNLKLEAF